MINAPLTMLPSVTHSRLCAMPAKEMASGCSVNSAIENSVMLATECSKPLPMKAKRHQKMAMHFAESLVMRAAIHSARHTSQLHRMARAKSASDEIGRAHV